MEKGLVRVSQIESDTADSLTSASKYIPVALSDPDLKGKNDNGLKTFIPISILLLYRRDDLKIAQRAAALRDKLQSECGANIKVLDSSFLILQK